MDQFAAAYSTAAAFSFDNPAAVDTTAAAEDVLLSTDSSAQKARKLFLLERMHQKTPPSAKATPERTEFADYGDFPGENHNSDDNGPRLSINLQKANRLSIHSPDAARRVTAQPHIKHRLRKTAAVAYDPEVTALGVDATTARFFELRELFHGAAVALPLRQRIELCRDVAAQVKDLHEGDAAGHGMLLTSCFASCETLRVVIGEASLGERLEAVERTKDVLDLGMILIDALLRANCLEELPELLELFKGAELSVDLPLRSLLTSRACPGSLIELACQMCSADVTLRPTAEDAHAWLESIVEDMRTAGQDEGFTWHDDGDAVLALRRVEHIKPARPRKDAAHHDGYSSDATSTVSFASDDSFLPDNTRPRGSSRLSDFIARNPTPEAAPAPQPPSRSHSAEDVLLHVPRKIKLVRDAKPALAAKPKVASVADLAALFNAQKRLSEEDALAVVRKADEKLRKDPNVLALSAPCVVVGDIHGQWFDLQAMMARIGGEMHRQTLIFLGDYVDRGQFSCECLLYLFALKAHYPANVFLLRGNHESEAVCSYFGFREEAEAKYGRTFFHRCVLAFQAMPLACTVSTVAGSFLCLHGGLSPSIATLAQLSAIDRFTEPGMNGSLCDVLWSDPVNEDEPTADFAPNQQRGCSFRFGMHALSTFMKANRLSALIRAHEVQQAGYKVHFVNSDVPPVVTVFSAPNYCGRYGNRGAFLRVHAKSQAANAHRNAGRPVRPLEIIEPVQFSETEHPPPVALEHRQQETESGLHVACPYMPTTFYGFSSRAVALARTRLVHVVSAQPAATLKAPRSFKSPLDVFKNAAQSDALNEMSPRVVAGKAQEAKRRLSIMGADRKDADVVVSVGSQGKPASRKKTILRNPSIVGSRAAAMLSSEDEAALAEEAVVSFSAGEMLAIQTLFLLVDRTDKGYVDAADMVAWASEMSGMDVGLNEAQRVVGACDIDGDGKVSLDDFLAMVGAMKDAYLVEELARINALKHKMESEQ